MEYTLEDALETLRDARTERCNEIENVLAVISDNGSVALSKACNSKDVNKMQHKFFKKLLIHVLQEEPKDYPIPRTFDLYTEVLWEIREAVRDAQELFDKMQSVLSDIKEDILYLKHKKEALQKMKEVYLDAVEMKAKTDYYEEYQITKRMFHSIKTDLQEVVDILFPDNEGFKIFFSILISAYIKGGDDMYVDTNPKVADLVHFLIEANIVSYHRYDRNKVRLIDMS